MITTERLKELLYLDEETFRFYWKKSGKGIKPNRLAGSFDAHGYGQIRIDGKVYKEHRLVWLYMTGSFPKGQIDHINHDRRDNRFCNLRDVTNMENHLNRPMQRSNTSGFTGVSFNKLCKKFEAYITVNRERLRLGYFEDLAQAIAARKEANKKYGYSELHGVGYGISKKKKNQFASINLLRGL